MLGYFFQNQMPFPFLTFPYYFREKSTAMLDILSWPARQENYASHTWSTKYVNCHNRCLTCAFCNSTVFKSSKLGFFSPKLPKFKSLLEIMSKDSGTFKATKIWTRKEKQSEREQKNVPLLYFQHSDQYQPS